MKPSPLITLTPSSPSFNSYSSSKLEEIAARVGQEFAHESESNNINSNDDNIFSWHGADGHFLPLENNTADQNHNELRDRNKDEVAEDDNDAEEEFEFEFAVVCQETELSPISADDIFYNGQIRPMYPPFNTDLLLNDHLDHANPSLNSKSAVQKNQPKKSHRLPLRKLFDEERLETASCSSSEADEPDELDGVMAGTYCMWTHKKAEEPRGSCNKSSSSGSSKRWKLRDLLYRSNSDGKETFVFFTKNGGKKSGGGGDEVEDYKLEKGKELGKGVVFEEHYVKSRAMKEGDKRRSFLPCRQDLVGFLANVNGVGRNLHPF